MPSATISSNAGPISTGATAPPATIRVASVNYFNAKPLIAGLGERDDVDLALDVPSKLLRRLQDETADIALLPVIDYQRIEGATLLPTGGGIGCDGATLTVRIFSQTPLDRIDRLCCDPDSHTSVALARIVMKRLHGRVPELAPLHAVTGAPGEARLLIGDKVVCEEPVGFEHQLDLGAAWKQLTGLPFVFACWTARAGVELGDIIETLADCRTRGLGMVDELIKKHAIPRGWPPGIAHRYLTQHLHYEVGERQLEAIELYHRYAEEDGIIPRAHPLVH
ncbi:MAG: menaquinone biosynthesis protein [Planctomycetota bacterium]